MSRHSGTFGGEQLHLYGIYTQIAVAARTGGIAPFRQLCYNERNLYTKEMLSMKRLTALLMLFVSLFSFAQADEVIVEDPENGVWSYTSDVFSVSITRAKDD